MYTFNSNFNMIPNKIKTEVFCPSPHLTSWEYVLGSTSRHCS